MIAFEKVFRLLTEHDIRFVIVGGIAVILHGSPRLTADLDIIIDLEPANAAEAIRVLQREGFIADIPVDIREFADEDVRRSWITEKNMKALSLHDREMPPTVIDILADSPIAFDDLYRRSKLVSLNEMTLRIASIPDLIVLKRLSGRPEDLSDIAELEKING
jgi:predicted nucleotidyltransferase